MAAASITFGTVFILAGGKGVSVLLLSDPRARKGGWRKNRESQLPEHYLDPLARPSSRANQNGPRPPYLSVPFSFFLFFSEVSPDKKIVRLHRDVKKPGIHHFQILDTNGKALDGRPLR
jgi:hypothetical protein